MIDCKTSEEFDIEIDEYMGYYNNYRYQLNQSCMSPKTYGDKLKNIHNKMAARI